MNHPTKVTTVLVNTCIATLATGCASPPVVQERQTGDQALSCEQLILAVDEAREFERRARGERRATGTNVAAALFFWPGLIATYANTGEAIDAAQERQRYLTGIYESKNCDQAKMGGPTQDAPPSTPAQSLASGAYIVAAISGAPAFAEPNGEGEPIHTFANGAALTIIESTVDNRWYKVLIPDGRTGYVPTANIQGPTVSK